MGNNSKTSEKIVNSMVVGACQSSQFFKQRACFLGNNRAFSKFGDQNLHYLISIIGL